MPMTDAQRFEFELAVIPHLEKQFRSKAPAPYVPPKTREQLSVELLKRIYGVKGMDIVQDPIKKRAAERRTQSGGIRKADTRSNHVSTGSQDRQAVTNIHIYSI